MFAVQVIDSEDIGHEYGILVCLNDNITLEDIENKVIELKITDERQYRRWDERELLAQLPAK